MTSDSHTQEKIRGSLLSLEQYIRAQDYTGYDPYDALTSPLFRLPVLRKVWLPRFVSQQILKRVPLNFRALLRIPRGRNPVTFALCLHGYTSLASGFPEEKEQWHKQADSCVDEIERLQSRGYSGSCWGYDFDWEDRHARTPAFTPTIVATGIVTNSLFRYYQATGSERPFELCRSAKEFVMKDLKKSWKNGTFCYSYSPGDSRSVLNATMKGARLLAQVFSVTGEQNLVDEARNTVAYALGEQRESGAWEYARADGQNWVDNFHTGYLLDCLDEFVRLTHADDYRSSLSRGWHYYEQNFFGAEGVPKYYDTATYPVDSTAAAQSILTLCRFGRLDLALRVALWMIDRMQDPRGYFYYQMRKRYTNKIPYMRWSNAGMFAALSILLMHLHSASGLRTAASESKGVDANHAR